MHHFDPERQHLYRFQGSLKKQQQKGERQANYTVWGESGIQRDEDIRAVEAVVNVVAFEIHYYFHEAVE